MIGVEMSSGQLYPKKLYTEINTKSRDRVDEVRTRGQKRQWDRQTDGEII